MGTVGLQSLLRNDFFLTTIYVIVINYINKNAREITKKLTLAHIDHKPTKRIFANNNVDGLLFFILSDINLQYNIG